MVNRTKNILLAIFSAGLLVLAFPIFDWGIFAWVGLVPLFIAISGQHIRYSTLVSFICGLLFFLGSFFWIFEIRDFRIYHHVPLLCYMASYFACFGSAFSFIDSRWGTVPALFAAPFIWTALETLRAHMFFLALPWAILAHSQYRYLTIIQLSALTGAYGLSFLIVLVNASLAAIVLSVTHRVNSRGRRSDPLPMRRLSLVMAGTAALLTAASLVYGRFALSKSESGPQFRVAVVQGNIDQNKKWDQRYANAIMNTYSELTAKAAMALPKIILWPETATPWSISRDPELHEEVKQIARKASTHLLVGSAHGSKFVQNAAGQTEFFNSAYLIGPQPATANNQRYDKIKLLPWGEYLPLKGIVPWSRLNVPEPDNFVRGDTIRILNHPDFRFGVTICWENIFPDLFRQFVRQGAQFMVNLTNEAWFGRTAAPYQFLAMNVFRAVENRRFVIRCANTGVSCFIDPHGRIVDRVRDEGGADIFVRGVLTRPVMALEEKTFYTMHGDWPAWLSTIGALLLVSIAVYRHNPIGRINP